METSLIVAQRNFSEELALLFVYNDDFDRARHYASCGVETFLQDWSSMDALQATSRAHTLQRLQRLAELQEFLAFVSKPGALKSSRKLLVVRLPFSDLCHSPDSIIFAVGSLPTAFFSKLH